MGEKLKAARKAAGLTQEELGNLIGCSQGEISRLEAGRMPSVPTLKKLAQVLGVSMESLV